MTLFKSFLVLFLLLMIPYVSRAGVLVEPYIGYTQGAYESGAIGIKMTGPNYGARVGYQTMGFMVGAEYGLSAYGVELDKAPAGIPLGTKDDWAGSYMGAFIGYNLPTLLRIWGSYFLDAVYEDDAGAGIGDEISGSGHGLGLGFTGLPFMSLNLEYRAFDLDESADASSGETVAITDTTTKEVRLSISFPFEI